MRPILEKYITGSVFCGIAIEIREEESLYRVCLVKKKGRHVKLSQVVSDIINLSDIQGIIGKNIPVALSVTGRGVLYKTIRCDENIDRQLLFRKAFPNAVPAEFYFSSCFTPHSGEHVIAIVRKSLCDPILEEFSRSVSVVSLDVGVLRLTGVLPLLPECKHLIAGRHGIEVHQHCIVNVKWEDADQEVSAYQIGTEIIPANQLISFATALHQFIPSKTTDILPDGKEQFYYRQLLRKTNQFALVFVLLTLVINFFFFQHYRSSIEKFSKLPGAHADLTEQIEQLRTDVGSRREFLTSSGLLGDNEYAWYADQLAHSMPDGIQLTRMNFSPKLNLNVEDSIGFSARQLVVSGNCTESLVLNQWLQALKSEAWLRTVALRSYVQDGKTGVFTLDMEI